MRVIGKKAPKAPDPYATAQAQAQVNTQTATQQAGINADTARLQNTMNRTNTFSPQGSVTNVNLGDEWFEKELTRNRDAFNNRAPGSEGLATDGVFDEARVRNYLNANNPNRDRWESRVTLSPEQQRLYDQDVQLDTRTGQMALDQLPRLGALLSQDVNTADLPAWALDDVDARNRASEAIRSRMEPQFQRDREGLEARLLSQGFVPGSEAYNRAADELGRARTDARIQTDAAGMAESRAGAAFSNNTRGAQLAERLQLRAQPINEVSALFGLGSGMQAPGQIQMANTQVGGTGINAPDLAGAIQSNYAARSGNYNALLGMYGQVAGAAAGAATGRFLQPAAATGPR